MKKKLLALLLAAVLTYSLLPTAALADGPDYSIITNYEQLLAVKDSSSTYILDPAADFGWPAEETELSVSTTLRMRGDWTIPAQVTLDFSGSLTPDYESGDYCWRTLTVDGTLILYPRHAFQVYRMVIGGKLILNGYDASLSVDEGELLSTGTLQLKSDISTYSFNLSDGPWYGRHSDTAEYQTHWVFHEGAQFLGRENNASAGQISIPGTGEENAPGVLLEAVGAVQCPYQLVQFDGADVTLKGDWKLDGISVRGSSNLLIDGSAIARYLHLTCSKTGSSLLDNDPTRCARITVPSGSTLALEKWGDNNFSASSDADGNTELVVNGTLRLGEGTRNDSELSIIGAGTLDARARYEDGTYQPRFFTSSGEFTMNDVILDRAAYADAIAETITIERNWKLVPKILTQPQSVTVNAGEEAAFTVEAKPAETYQWMYNDGSNHSCTDEMGTGANTDTFRFIAKPEYDGCQFFCVVTSDGVTRVTDRPTLTVLGPSLEITSQPKSVSAVVDKTATFQVAATGENLTYQWQYKAPGGSWKNTTLSGNKTDTLKVSATCGRHNYQYRCVITDGNGITLNSNAVKLTVLGVKTQPKAVSTTAGKTATFKVVATGENLTYQWQYRAPGGSWKNTTLSGNKTDTLKVSATCGRDGYQYRCAVKSGSNTVYSDGAKLTVFGIKTQPANVTGTVGKNVSMKVVATGENLTYQWQYQTDTGTWKNTTLTGAKTATLKIPVTLARDGNVYRCVVKSGSSTATSKSAKLTAFAIKTQPKDVTAAKGSTATLKVVAVGENLTYQWQYQAADGTWKNTTLTGAKTATLSIPATAARNGNVYRCIVKSGTSTITSNAAKLTVK